MSQSKMLGTGQAPLEPTELFTQIECT